MTYGIFLFFPMTDPDQVRNSYQLCSNGTLRVMYANGMSISFHSEPHVLAGTVTPAIGRCNISLPMENGLNSIEWRLRKEQIKGKVTVFGRKLRVSPITNLFLKLLFSSTGFSFFKIWKHVRYDSFRKPDHLSETLDYEWADPSLPLRESIITGGILDQMYARQRR